MIFTGSPNTPASLIRIMLDRGTPVVLLTDQAGQPRLFEPIERREPRIVALDAFLAYELHEVSNNRYRYDDIHLVELRSNGSAHVTPAIRLTVAPRSAPIANRIHAISPLDLNKLVRHAADLQRGGSSLDEAAQRVVQQHANADLIFWDQVRQELIAALESDTTEPNLELADDFTDRLMKLAETDISDHTPHMELLVELLRACLE
jgi:hypothetical protein